MFKKRGYTLFEILITIALLGILFGLAAPNYQKFIYQTRAETYMTKLMQTISYAQQQARQRNVSVIICPLDSEQQCDPENNWSQGISVFIDPNELHKVNQSEDILKEIKAVKSPAQLQWQGALGKNYLLIAADGSLHNQNGSFVYSVSGYPAYTRKLVISAAGRMRIDI